MTPAETRRRGRRHGRREGRATLRAALAIDVAQARAIERGDALARVPVTVAQALLLDALYGGAE